MAQDGQQGFPNIGRAVRQDSQSSASPASSSQSKQSWAGSRLRSAPRSAPLTLRSLDNPHPFRDNSPLFDCTQQALP